MTKFTEYEAYNLLAEIPAESLPEHVQHLIRLGRLSQKQVAKIVAQQSKSGSNFATAAIELGLLTRQEILVAQSRQYSYPILSGHTSGSQFSNELVVGHEPFGEHAEAIRSVRTSLVSTAIAQGVRSLVVTGARKGAGASFFCANIAMAFAQMSMPALLVDANLRDARIAPMFGLSEHGEGLSDFLRGNDDGHIPISSDVIPGLSILAAGEVPPNPQELLSSAAFIALANNLERMFGVVIYDTAPAMEFADASIVVARVGSAIIVARKHETAFDDVATMAKKFRATQCKFFGTVLNEY
jgi:chain length determinant protein tyrosine kinase EpsG